MQHTEDRKRIIECARTWVRTPFHDNARLKGIGVDCAQFVAAVYEEAGLIPHIVTPSYSSQFFMHKAEERLIAHVSQYALEIEERQAAMGDLVLYKWGHAFAHAAIIVEWPKEIIHAHKRSGLVLPARGFDSDLKGRATRFFSLWKSE